jgi:hypothetical protein
MRRTDRERERRGKTERESDLKRGARPREQYVEREGERYEERARGGGCVGTDIKQVISPAHFLDWHEQTLAYTHTHAYMHYGGNYIRIANRKNRQQDAAPLMEEERGPKWRRTGVEADCGHL